MEGLLENQRMKKMPEGWFEDARKKSYSKLDDETRDRILLHYNVYSEKESGELKKLEEV